MQTITLAKAEATVIERHLVVAHDRLLPSHADRICIDVLLSKMRTDRTMVLARLEVFCMLRALRAQRAALRADMEAIEERRMRGGFNGQLNDTWRLLDADAMVIDDVRRRLWEMI